MPMQWNEQADARLFANVLKLHVVKIDYAALAKSMGENVTPKAISHRISKIKEKATARRNADWEQHYNQVNRNVSGGATPTVGKKRGPKPKSSHHHGEDGDDRSKRIKAEHVAVVKSEPGIGEDVEAEAEAEAEAERNAEKEAKVGHVPWSGMGWGPEEPQQLAQAQEGEVHFYDHQNIKISSSDEENEGYEGLGHDYEVGDNEERDEENQHVVPEGAAATIDYPTESLVSIIPSPLIFKSDDHDYHDHHTDGGNGGTHVGAKML